LPEKKKRECITIGLREVTLVLIRFIASSLALVAEQRRGRMMIDTGLLAEASDKSTMKKPWVSREENNVA
jgi:hypothetical protein